MVEKAQGHYTQQAACRPYLLARNEGFRRLLSLYPALEYVFFVDGDSEIVAGWPDVAVRFLDGHPDVGATTGRVREQHPDASVYNMLFDIDWLPRGPSGLERIAGSRIRALSH